MYAIRSELFKYIFKMFLSSPQLILLKSKVTSQNKKKPVDRIPMLYINMLLVYLIKNHPRMKTSWGYNSRACDERSEWCWVWMMLRIIHPSFIPRPAFPRLGAQIRTLAQRVGIWRRIIIPDSRTEASPPRRSGEETAQQSQLTPC